MEAKDFLSRIRDLIKQIEGEDVKEHDFTDALDFLSGVGPVHSQSERERDTVRLIFRATSPEDIHRKKGRTTTELFVKKIRELKNKKADKDKIKEAVSAYWEALERRNVEQKEEEDLIEFLNDVAGLKRDLADNPHIADYVGHLLDHVVPYSYVASKMQIGHLVTCKPVPQHLAAFASEAMEAYAMGLENAACSLCRTMIETASFEICKDKALLRPDDRNKFGEYPPIKLMQRAAKGQRRFNDMYSFYIELSSYIHGESTVSGDTSMKLKRAFRIVEDLYDLHYAND